MRITELKEYQRGGKRGLFSHLPPNVKQLAFRILKGFRERWARDLPRWRYAILVGQAKRLALNPPDSEWGRSMLAKRGGYAVQEKYRREGRHPTEKATRTRLLRQKGRKVRQTQLGGAATRFTIPPANAQAHLLPIGRPNLPPPPSIEARRLHKQLDPPGCRCYYCAWPNHEP